MGDMNTSLNRLPQLSPTPLWKLFEPTGSAPVGGGATIPADSLALSGGAGPAAPPNGMTQQQYAQFVADSTAMLTNADPRQRFQAIINMTKMNPSEAIPLLQQASQNDNPQVVQLAQKALSAMEQMPGATAAAPAVGAPAVPSAIPTLPSVATPAMPGAPVPPMASPAMPGVTPPVAAPGMPAVPSVAMPTAAAPVATMPNGQPANFSQLLVNYNTASDPEVKAQTLLQMEQCASSDRQNVVNMMLTVASMQQFPGPTAEEVEAAISVLRDLKAPEAVPFLQSIQMNTGVSAPVRQAASGALQAIQGGQTTGMPSTAMPTTAMPATAMPAAPMPTTAMPTAGVPAAAPSSLPSFLH